MFFALFISSKYEIHIDAERMIVKTREMQRTICVDGLKKMYGTIPLLKEVIADVCRLRPTKFIFVMRGSRQFCQRGSNYDNVVFFICS